MSGGVLVIGGTGYVGSALLAELRAQGYETLGIARGSAGGTRAVTSCDATDPTALRAAMHGKTYVVNAMTGPPAAILAVAQNLGAELVYRRDLRIVQLGSAAVFGQSDGCYDEHSDPQPLWWHSYGQAHLRAEQMLLQAANMRGRSLVLRIGCIYGARSPQWVDRIGRLLLAGRLGRLGRAGAGVAPLLHVTDLVHTIVRCLQDDAPAGVWHLLSPGPVTWNAYFCSFAQALKLGEGRALPPGSMVVEAYARMPLCSGLNGWLRRQNDFITPSMRHLFASRARIVSCRPPRTPSSSVPLDTGIAEAAAVFIADHAGLQYNRQQHLRAAA